jgi:hypothetical protein
MTKEAKDKAFIEAEILKRNQHENLVKYIDDFIAKDSKFEYLCIVIEHIEG